MALFHLPIMDSHAEAVFEITDISGISIERDT